MPNVKDEPRAPAGEPLSSNEKARSSALGLCEIAALVSALALAAGSALSSCERRLPDKKAREEKDRGNKRQHHQEPKHKWRVGPTHGNRTPLASDHTRAPRGSSGLKEDDSDQCADKSDSAGAPRRRPPVDRSLRVSQRRFVFMVAHLLLFCRTLEVSRARRAGESSFFE